MFNNAGMNQFKDLFLGNSVAKNSRVANSQKCLRVSGKHNDLEEVGVDTYHHTMFEMLGNWSFGDYFKQDAIDWAWELLTEVYKIDKSRIYVSVFSGDKDDNLDKDQEAIDIWKKHIAEDRILEFDRKDNFWEMGDQGPCGPCSEIHIDTRPDEERAKVDGKSLVNADHPQVIEIWNLVFMQYNRMADRSLVPLPNKHVDTGMGFERLAMVMQGKQSNYDTDVFMPLIEKVVSLSGKKYNSSDSKEDIATRVISDHVRAISFSITDGQLPSNTGAGYVIRRILRRAVRYGYQTLGLTEPFIHQLVPVLAEELGGAFTELRDQKDLVAKVIKEEETSFFRTLAKGVSRFEEWSKQGKGEVDGKFAFELYDTFGFPIDLTRLMAEECGKSVNEKEFEACLSEQKERSRKATAIETEDWVELKKDDVEEFIGYDHEKTNVYITRYRKIKVKGKDKYQLVFNLTPFYAEGGGQVGERGYIEHAGTKTYILDTKKENNLIVHFADKLPVDPSVKFHAVVDGERRRLSAANHSATHLLHEALREVLGTHVEQKGSLVNSEYLRFDFSHFQKVTDEELALIEQKVSDKVRENLALEEFRRIPIEEAKEKGAMALFGEKYGDVVRVIQFGTSIELCGGIHVKATGDIGMFKLVSEGAVAAGIRRIEAITADKAFAFVNEKVELVDDLKALLKNPKDIKKAIEDLMSQNQKLNKQIEALNKEKAVVVKKELLDSVKEINGVNFIGQKVSLDSDSIKNVAFQLKGQVDNLFMILGAESAGKATITVVVSENLVEEKDLNAGKIIRDLAKEIQGGGGGQAFFATAGGKNPNGIPAAIQKAEELVG